MQTKKVYMLGMFTGMIAIILIYVTIGMFFPNLLSGRSNDLSSATAIPPGETMPVFSTIGSKIDAIINELNKNYVESINWEDFSDKLYREAVALLNDPYTVYMDAKQFRDFMEDTEGVYAGIGVYVNADMETDRIMVVVPMEGYPGEKAGLLPGDAIVKVNGYDVTAEMLNEAVAMLKGEPGTSVDVTIYRDSIGEHLEISIIREIINVPTVNHKMMDGEIGYLRITQFERVTYQQFVNAYNDLNSQGMKGLILDLRNNPGGLLTTVNQITDLLVPEGTIVYTEDKAGNKVYTPSNATHIEIPLLVLVNGNSASASEVLSGAVKDHGIGELVGTNTFGKGLVQSVYTLSDNSAVKITIAKYYTPNGICLQGTGIKPDYEIDMDNELTVKISSLTLEEDIQLKRAWEIMTEKLQ